MFQERYGDGAMGTAIMAIPIVGTWLCEVSIITYVARILFAYSRDDAVPFSYIWKVVDRRTGTPLNAVWGTTLIATVVGLAFLRSNFAINAILSLSGAWVVSFTAALHSISSCLYCSDCAKCGLRDPVRAAVHRRPQALSPGPFLAGMDGVSGGSDCALLGLLRCLRLQPAPGVSGYVPEP